MPFQWMRLQKHFQTEEWASYHQLYHYMTRLDRSDLTGARAVQMVVNAMAADPADRMFRLDAGSVIKADPDALRLPFAHTGKALRGIDDGSFRATLELALGRVHVVSEDYLGQILSSIATNAKKTYIAHGVGQSEAFVQGLGLALGLMKARIPEAKCLESLGLQELEARNSASDYKAVIELARQWDSHYDRGGPQ